MDGALSFLRGSLTGWRHILLLETIGKVNFVEYGPFKLFYRFPQLPFANSLSVCVSELFFSMKGPLSGCRDFVKATHLPPPSLSI